MPAPSLRSFVRSRFFLLGVLFNDQRDTQQTVLKQFDRFRVYSTPERSSLPFGDRVIDAVPEIVHDPDAAIELPHVRVLRVDDHNNLIGESGFRHDIRIVRALSRD
jgi:hypothetical protein